MPVHAIAEDRPGSTSSETDWIGRPEVAQILGVHRNVVTRLMVRGVLPYSRLPGGCQPRFLRHDIEAIAQAAISRHVNK
jgi:predicted DNA-binding transcriptional regulator AlpA